MVRLDREVAAAENQVIKAQNTANPKRDTWQVPPSGGIAEWELEKSAKGTFTISWGVLADGQEGT